MSDHSLSDHLYKKKEYFVIIYSQITVFSTLLSSAFKIYSVDSCCEDIEKKGERNMNE